MGYRIIKADKIFDGYQVHEGSVLVMQDNGAIEGIMAEKEAGEPTEVHEGMLIPGLVNCHCHLELSHMRGLIPEATGLVDFVFNIVTKRHFSEEDILIAIGQAENDMIRNGIVAVGDICNNALTIPQKQKGRLGYYNFIESSGWLPSLSGTRFSRAVDLFNAYETQIKTHKTINRTSIVPHAPYSVSQELWQCIQPYFENRVVSIHNQETAFEDQFFEEGKGDFIRMYELMKIDNAHHKPTGRSSLQSYFQKLQKASGKILVHNTFTKEQDIDYINDHTGPSSGPVYFCLCVNANLYIERTLPPVRLFRKSNCNIVLGTDSLASNWSLSIWDEIKTIRKHFPDIPLEELLQWGTINGAKALQMAEVYGSFEKGKKPGVNLLSEGESVIKNL